MSSYFSFQEGETLQEWQARIAKIQAETKAFEQLLTNISHLARQVDSVPEMHGYMEGWLTIMFADLHEDRRTVVMDKFVQFDNALVLKKLSQVPS